VPVYDFNLLYLQLLSLET